MLLYSLKIATIVRTHNSKYCSVGNGCGFIELHGSAFTWAWSLFVGWACVNIYIYIYLFIFKQSFKIITQGLTRRAGCLTDLDKVFLV